MSEQEHGRGMWSETRIPEGQEPLSAQQDGEPGWKHWVDPLDTHFEREEKPQETKLALAAMLIGIFGVLTSPVQKIAFVLGPLALGLGIFCRVKRFDGRRLATAAIWLGAVTILVGLSMQLFPFLFDAMKGVTDGLPQVPES